MPKKNLYSLVENVDVDKGKKNHYLVGKFNTCLREKNQFLASKELLIFPLNPQDKKITILRGLSKDTVTITLVFGPCSVVI